MSNTRINTYGPLSDHHITLIASISSANPETHPHYFTAPEENKSKDIGQKQQKILKAIFGNTSNINEPNKESPIGQALKHKHPETYKIVVSQKNAKVYEAACMPLTSPTTGIAPLTLKFEDIIEHQKNARLYYDSALSIEEVKEFNDIKAQRRAKKEENPPNRAAYLSTTFGEVTQYFSGKESTRVERRLLLADIKYPNLSSMPEARKYCASNKGHKHHFKPDGLKNFIQDIKAIITFNLLAAHKHNTGLNLTMPDALFQKLTDDDKQEAKKAFLIACVDAAAALKLEQFTGLVLHGDGEEGEFTLLLKQKLEEISAQLSFPVFLAQGLTSTAFHLAATENNTPLAFADSIQRDALKPIGGNALSRKPSKSKNASYCRESAGESVFILSPRYNPFIQETCVAIKTQIDAPVESLETSPNTIDLDLIEDRKKLSAMLFNHFHDFSVTIMSDKNNNDSNTEKTYLFVLENLSIAEQLSLQLLKQFKIGTIGDANRAKKPVFVGEYPHVIRMSSSDCNTLFNALVALETENEHKRKPRKVMESESENTSPTDTKQNIKADLSSTTPSASSGAEPLLSENLDTTSMTRSGSLSMNKNSLFSQSANYSTAADHVRIAYFQTFKKDYFKSFHSAWFKKPDRMKAKLDSGVITNIEQVIEYAREKPKSRTAQVLATFDFLDEATAFIIAYFDAFNPVFSKKSGMMSALDTPEKRQQITRQTIHQYAMNKPHSLAAKVLNSLNDKQINTSFKMK